VGVVKTTSNRTQHKANSMKKDEKTAGPKLVHDDAPHIKPDGLISVPAPVASVVVLTDAEIKDQRSREHVRALGNEIVRLTVGVGEKYLELCRYIRSEKLAPALVSKELKETGMNKVRISEINRVAQCGDELWNEFEARAIGFKKVLEIERGSVQKLIAETSGESAEAIENEFKESGLAGGGDSAQPKTDEEKIAARLASIGKCAKSILLGASFLAKAGQKRQAIEFSQTLGEGWTLILSKDKASTAKGKTGAASDKK